MDLKKLAEKHWLGSLMNGDDDRGRREESKLLRMGARGAKGFMDFGAGLAVILADRYGGEDMVLNESILRTRIANLQAQGVDTSEENCALAEMALLQAAQEERAPKSTETIEAFFLRDCLERRRSAAERNDKLLTGSGFKQ